MRGRIARGTGWLALTLVVGSASACSPAPGPMNWSIRAYNGEGIDLVLRLVADGKASYFRFPDGGDALVAGDSGVAPRTVSIASLDPASCRPIDEVDALPGAHAWISAGFGGTIGGASTYDPRDYGDDWGASQRLASTDRCSDLDPAATPRPAPTMTVGDWLNGWEMSCKTRGDKAAFGVRGEFLDGAVSGCEAAVGPAGHSIPESAIVVWNPSDREDNLAVAWRDRRCVSGATVSLLPESDHYTVNVISIGNACESRTTTYSTTFILTAPIDAQSVNARLDPVADP